MSGHTSYITKNPSTYIIDIEYKHKADPNYLDKSINDDCEFKCTEYIEAFIELGCEPPGEIIECSIKEGSIYSVDHVIIMWSGPVVEGFTHVYGGILPENCIVEVLFHCRLLCELEGDDPEFWDDKKGCYNFNYPEPQSRYSTVSVPDISKAIAVYGNIFPEELYSIDGVPGKRSYHQYNEKRSFDHPLLSELCDEEIEGDYYMRGIFRKDLPDKLKNEILKNSRESGENGIDLSISMH